jgi:hypothetical protein
MEAEWQRNKVRLDISNLYLNVVHYTISLKVRIGILLCCLLVMANVADHCYRNSINIVVSSNFTSFIMPASNLISLSNLS